MANDVFTAVEQKPVFVYGTLRAGQGNYWGILAGATLQERLATLEGYTLLDSGVPFAVKREGRIVVGEGFCKAGQGLQQAVAVTGRAVRFRRAECDSAPYPHGGQDQAARKLRVSLQHMGRVSHFVLRGPSRRPCGC